VIKQKDIKLGRGKKDNKLQSIMMPKNINNDRFMNSSMPSSKLDIGAQNYSTI